MLLKKGDIIGKENRYRLEERMGTGATAEVWKALDGKLNMMVALKIFAKGANMGADEINMFKDELRRVYPIKHQNLLTPTHYDAYDGMAYLVMPIMENGEATSLVGRASADETIQMLHDVAAGLACLHRQNPPIIHQDIKPANFLLDDNLRFLITDFGISVVRNDSISNALNGGTVAYMSPERFKSGAVATTMSDIWALGASAFEMLTGEMPYGEDGGQTQAVGIPIADFPANIEKGLKELILQCLNSDPQKRPTAHEIEIKTERRIRTGSWNDIDGGDNIKAILIAGVTAVLMGVIFVADHYLRTKVYYYADYIERYDVPEGIGRVFGDELRHRETTYRFETKRGQVVRVSAVNKNGRVVEDLYGNDADMKFVYNRDGSLLKEKQIYDIDGNEKYVETYSAYEKDNKGRTYRPVSIMQGGTQISLPNQENAITKFHVYYNNNGERRLVKYFGADNKPICRDDNVYGVNFEYKENGDERIGMITNLDEKECPAENSNGIMITKIVSGKFGRKYMEFYDKREKPCADERKVAKYVYSYDDYGNYSQIEYFDEDGNMTVDELKYGGVKREYDWENDQLKITYLDSESHTQVYAFLEKYNENGRTIETTFFDEENQIIWTKTCEYDSKGRVKVATMYDRNGNMTRDYDGVCQYKYEYEKDGDFDIKIASYYDENGKLTNKIKRDNNWTDTLESITEEKYDKNGLLVSVVYFDEEGDSCPFRYKTINGTTYSWYKEDYIYNGFGKVSERVFYGANKKVILRYNKTYKNGVPNKEMLYDSEGRLLISQTYDPVKRVWKEDKRTSPTNLKSEPDLSWQNAIKATPADDYVKYFSSSSRPLFACTKYGNFTASSVTFYFKAKKDNEFEMNRQRRADLKSYIEQAIGEIRKKLNIPKSVKIKYECTDVNDDSINF